MSNTDEFNQYASKVSNNLERCEDTLKSMLEYNIVVIEDEAYVKCDRRMMDMIYNKIEDIVSDIESYKGNSG